LSSITSIDYTLYGGVHDSSFELRLPVTTMETNVSLSIKVKMQLLPLLWSWIIVSIVSPVISYCKISGIRVLVRLVGGAEVNTIMDPVIGGGLIIVGEIVGFQVW